MPNGPLSLVEPTGLFHTTERVFRSTTPSVPYGGFWQGTNSGDMNGRVVIAYGVPACWLTRKPSGIWSRGYSCNRLLITSGFTTMSRFSSSIATLPQLKPPALPGNCSVPVSVGGVKWPS